MLQWMLMMKSPIQPPASIPDPLESFLGKFKQLKAANFTQRRWWNVLSKNPPEGLEIEISPRNLTQTLCPAQPIMRITATTLQLRSA